MHSRLLWLDNREPNPEALINPSMAQYHLWLAQAQRDHGNFSGREMAQMEGKARAMASHSRTLFNPFTGEVRKLNSNGEVEAPSSVFLGGMR
jgi:hypothetical protein